MKIAVNYKRIPARNHFESFLNGVKKHGVEVFSIDHPSKYKDCDLVFTHGTPKKAHPTFEYMDTFFKEQARRGSSVLVMDNGYLKRDSHVRQDDAYLSLGFNGLNGRATFVIDDMPSDRWDQLGIQLQPWEIKEGHILICGQLARDSSVQHLQPNYTSWMQKIVDDMSSNTDKQIIFRPHPLGLHETIKGVNISKKLNSSLLDEFNESSIVVAASSNSLVEAVVCGIPVFALDQGSLLWNYCKNKTFKDLASPQTFYRERWANNLAYSQWTKEEMESGLAWEHLKTVLDSGISLSYTNGLATSS